MSLSSNNTRRRVRGSSNIAFLMALAITVMAVATTSTRVHSAAQAHHAALVQQASAAGSAELDGTVDGIDAAIEAVLDSASDNDLSMAREQVIIGIHDGVEFTPVSVDNLSVMAPRANAVMISL